VADTRTPNPLMHQFVFDEAARLEKMTILPRIIAEQRQKGLSLGIGTQSMHQLDQELKNALTEVQGNFFVCRQGAEGAAAASKMFSVQGTKKDQPLFSESYFRNLPDLVTVIRTQDNVNGVDEIVQCVAKLPPLDRYMPNGQKARYKHATEEAKADAWTKAKVKELASKNGHHQSEVDALIRAYLQGETYEPKQVKKLQPKKPKAPLQAQPEAPVSLEKKTDSNVDPSKSITAVSVGEVETSQKESVKQENEHEQNSFATITLSKKQRKQPEQEQPVVHIPFKPMLTLSWESPIPKEEIQGMKETAAAVEPVSEEKEQVLTKDSTSMEPDVRPSQEKIEDLPMEPQPIVSLRKKKPSEKNE